MSTKPSAGRVRATYEFIKGHREEFSVQTEAHWPTQHSKTPGGRAADWGLLVVAHVVMSSG